MPKFHYFYRAQSLLKPGFEQLYDLSSCGRQIADKSAIKSLKRVAYLPACLQQNLFGRKHVSDRSRRLFFCSKIVGDFFSDNVEVTEFRLQREAIIAGISVSVSGEKYDLSTAVSFTGLNISRRRRVGLAA